MYRNKTKIRECKKTTPHLMCNFADVGWSCCILSFLPCFCTYSGPSLLEMNFAETYSLVCIPNTAGPLFNYTISWSNFTDFGISKQAVVVKLKQTQQMWGKNVTLKLANQCRVLYVTDKALPKPAYL